MSRLTADREALARTRAFDLETFEEVLGEVDHLRAELHEAHLGRDHAWAQREEARADCDAAEAKLNVARTANAALRGALELTRNTLAQAAGNFFADDPIATGIAHSVIAEADRALAAQDLPCLVARPGETTYECRVDNLCANCKARVQR